MKISTKTRGNGDEPRFGRRAPAGKMAVGWIGYRGSVPVDFFLLLLALSDIHCFHVTMLRTNPSNICVDIPLNACEIPIIAT